MSARINLLPREAEEREARRRAIGIALVGLLLVLAVLAGLYFLQVSRVNTARDRLAEEEAERDQLQAQADQLAPYGDLATRRDAAVQTVTAVLAAEASVAGILQDVAAVMPNDAALLTLTLTLAEAPEAPQGFDFGGPAFGTLTASGETFGGHAPGVERFILEFDKIAAFFDVFVSSSTVDEEGIASFTLEADLGPEILTGRYIDGLPEELR